MGVWYSLLEQYLVLVQVDPTGITNVDAINKKLNIFVGQKNFSFSIGKTISTTEIPVMHLMHHTYDETLVSLVSHSPTQNKASQCVSNSIIPRTDFKIDMEYKSERTTKTSTVDIPLDCQILHDKVAAAEIPSFIYLSITDKELVAIVDDDNNDTDDDDSYSSFETMQEILMPDVVTNLHSNSAEEGMHQSHQSTPSLPGYLEEWERKQQTKSNTDQASFRFNTRLRGFDCGSNHLRRRYGSSMHLDRNKKVALDKRCMSADSPTKMCRWASNGKLDGFDGNKSYDSIPQLPGTRRHLAIPATKTMKNASWGTTTIASPTKSSGLSQFLNLLLALLLGNTLVIWPKLTELIETLAKQCC
jgi:hypothetical protein